MLVSGSLKKLVLVVIDLVCLAMNRRVTNTLMRAVVHHILVFCNA